MVKKTMFSFKSNIIARQIVLITGKPFYSTSSSVPSEVRSFTKLIRHNTQERAGIVELCLNRPEAKNAFSIAFVKELMDKIEEIRSVENIRCLLVRSLAKNVFCAGADLKERLSATNEQVRHITGTLRHMCSLIESIPVPTIAVLDGGAYGGGLELALACDIRVGADNIQMGLVETKLAILPGAGGTQRLQRIVGISLAKELIFTARLLDGEEAKSIRLLNHLVPQNFELNAAYEKSLSLAELIVCNGPIGVRAAKVAIDKGSQVDLATGMTLEGLCYDRVIPTQDRIEGLKAFAGKYKPIYKGV
uniref:Enoyl-CoA hydratase domain-containing protein 2, mitochondrial n=1 Tax=Cacopsylla melanoneura TaxID=428564 RepID=A0A8D9DU73_9HEMI